MLTGEAVQGPANTWSIWTNPHCCTGNGTAPSLAGGQNWTHQQHPQPLLCPGSGTSIRVFGRLFGRFCVLEGEAGRGRAQRGAEGRAVTRQDPALLILTQEPNPALSDNPGVAGDEQNGTQQSHGHSLLNPALPTLSIHAEPLLPAPSKSPGTGGIPSACLPWSGSCWWAGNNSHMSTKAEEHAVFC